MRTDGFGGACESTSDDNFHFHFDHDVDDFADLFVDNGRTDDDIIDGYRWILDHDDFDVRTAKHHVDELAFRAFVDEHNIRAGR